MFVLQSNLIHGGHVFLVRVQGPAGPARPQGRVVPGNVHPENLRKFQENTGKSDLKKKRTRNTIQCRLQALKIFTQIYSNLFLK